MKKFFALVLALVMVLGLVACGEKAPAAEELLHDKRLIEAYLGG